MVNTIQSEETHLLEMIRPSEIEIDDDIYPRLKRSPQSVVSYVDALFAGATFPPLEIQKIIDGKNEDGSARIRIISLDGSHRLDAFKEYNKRIDEILKKGDVAPTKITQVKVRHWKREPLDKQKHLEDLRIVSLQFNLRHGVRVTDNDIQFQAERIVNYRSIEKLKGIVTELSDKFGCSVSRMSELVGSLVKNRQASRNSLILKLNLEGWKQQEISEIINLGQSTISEIIGNFGSEEIDNLFEKGSDPDKIADLYQMDIPTLWAIILKGETDDDRFEIFGKSDYGNDKPKIYDYWNFVKKDPRFSTNYAGYCFGQVLMNVLYRCTNQGDLVIDPMAGGGSTLDACLIMGRECRGYDIKPSRLDITENDIRDGYPDEAKNCDFIFLDPPYYKKKAENYNCPEIYESKEKHLKFLNKLIEDTFETLKTGGQVALLYSNYYDYKDGKETILAPDIYTLFTNMGFIGKYAIQTPLSGNAQYEAHDIERAKDDKIMLQIARSLYIFKKV